jgi:seryl-tRNA synthetase
MPSMEDFRGDTAVLKTRLESKGVSPEVVDEIVALDLEHRRVLAALEGLRAKHKRESGTAPASKPTADALTALQQQRDELSRLQDQERRLAEELQDRLHSIPAPVAIDPGEQPGGQEYSVDPQWLPFGGQMPLLKGERVRILRATVELAMDEYSEGGFREAILPALIRPEVLEGAADLPTMDGYLLDTPLDNLFLVSSLIAPLSAMDAGSILPIKELPTRWVTWGPAFNPRFVSQPPHRWDVSPASPFDQIGSYVCVDEQGSKAEFERGIAVISRILETLQLAHQVRWVPASSLGFAAQSACEHVVWMPAEGRHVRVSLSESFGQYLCRRTRTRLRRDGDKRTEPAFSLGQSLSAGRLVAAVIENHQRPDGTILVPPAIAALFQRTEGNPDGGNQGHDSSD